jgi:excisionase family DNA binding protein
MATTKTATAAPAESNPVWMTTEQVAEKLGLHPQTIRQWRHRGTVGPKSFKMGGAVRYKESDVDAWLEKHSRDTEQDFD